jgi:hypothetical protein
MRSFPATATDDEIRAAVVEWSEMLAQKRFGDALRMFEPASPMKPSELAEWISNYGSFEPYPDGRKYEVTSLNALAERDDIVSSIDVDRENLYGMDPNSYVGMVHYDRVPLNGEASDLTARFNVKKLDDGAITLEFEDIHVM